MATVPSHPRRTARLTSVAVLVAAIAVAAGCSAGNPRTHDPAAASPAGSTRPITGKTSATVSPTDVARRQALAAYQAMWNDMAIAARTADYQSPLLPQHAAGATLSTLTRGLYTDKRQGLVIKGHPVTHPLVRSVAPPGEPTRVVVVDCFDDTHWLNYKTSGGLQDHVPGGRHATTAVLSKDNGVWKVTELAVRASGTC